jgi:hypothetical protein
VSGAGRLLPPPAQHPTDHPPRAWPDVYFTPGYGTAACTEPGSWWLGLHRCAGLFQLPLVVRPLPGGRVDAASPYGYSGAWAHPDLPAADVAAAWRSVREELQDRRVVSVFLRHSPLVPQARLPFVHHRVVVDHPTVAVDLTDVDRAWTALRGTCRTAVRRARAHGGSVRIRPARAADLVAGSPFRRMYEATMDRHGAARSYYFTDDHYARLLAGLCDGLLLASGHDADGTVQTAALLLHHGPFLHYHLSGSTAAGSRAGLGNLLLWQAAEHGAALGARTLHLGGGTGAADDLLRFKASFGPTRLVYRATGWVVDPAAYAALAARTRSREGFFPAYRPR